MTKSEFTAAFVGTRWEGHFSDAALGLIYDYLVEADADPRYFDDRGAIACAFSEFPISYYAKSSDVDPAEYPLYDERWKEIPGSLDEEDYLAALVTAMGRETTVLGTTDCNPDEAAPEWDALVVFVAF